MSGAAEKIRLRVPICPYCGSEEVTMDAAVRWDTEHQEWSVSAIYDASSCDDCGEESKHGPDWRDAQ